MKNLIKNKIKLSTYNITLIEHFIRFLIKGWKKKKAINLLSLSLNYIALTINKDPISTLEMAVRYTIPVYLEVTPSIITNENKTLWHKRFICKSSKVRTFQAIKWIIKAAKEKKDKSLYIHLAKEIVDASRNSGKAVKYKEQMENKLKLAQLHM
uniref:Small ribosomal subunit protein uS7c n=1 Tax=Helicosporidium sp. subsp. Simulium jonesii TaxID=145475 RepID=RR7_HELSJ|nr:ribosomal protein S7 [Helicosporidium sp. ex Simulium jonesi]Q6RH25.1 RecName: Full=Small ribosomal subunit protein uS7c; AltName: Full=30S ribosomal protein S7, plastid [Helicosporidium sp. ex Simulium jonesi]AAS21039.1 rps7 [Helicosporidium sp. ex Simulium jonesi]ABD33986.1 ribosomal protein S7 [Helicosporidium sp. ex Simulium jonesi]